MPKKPTPIRPTVQVAPTSRATKKPQRARKDTPETREKILNAIREGAPFRHACMFAGISEDTFMRWREIDPDFADQVKLAEGQFTMVHLHNIRQHGLPIRNSRGDIIAPGSWQASAWLLERKYPQEFGRRTVEVTGRGGGAIEHEVTHRPDYSRLTPEEMENLDAILTKVEASGDGH